MATDISSAKNIQADMLAKVQDWTKDKEKLASLSEKDVTLWGTQTYNNGGQQAIDDIDKQIKAIEDEIEAWEKKLQGYQEEIDKINGDLGETTDNMADIGAEIASKEGKYERQLQEAISQAITDAVDKTKRNRQAGVNTTFTETFQASLNDLMQSGNSTLGDIAALYNNLGNEQSDFGKYASKIDMYINDSDLAMKGMKNASAIINVLKQTRGNMVAQKDNYYANKNNDVKAPVFTYEKETIVAELADKYGVELGDRANSNQTTGGTSGAKDEAKIAEITNSINELGKASKGSGDSYAAYDDNELMKNLETALFGDKEGATTIQEGSLVWQLAENGANNTEIMDILANAFGGLGIAKNGEGSYTIPYGHATNDEMAKNGRIISGRAPEVYSAVMSIANNTSGIPEPATTTPGDAKQLETAGKVVDELAAKGFSFKEAMYTLDQFFPGLDIGYSLGEQSSTAEGIVRFNSDESYTPLAEKIKGYTGEGKAWAGSQVVQAKKEEVKPAETKRTDPISIKTGDSRLYFMADDGNGQYDGVTDLLGSDNNEGMAGFRTKYGIPEDQNIIEGDALKGIMMMQLKEVQNEDGSVSVQQSFISAADAGITKIDLTPTNEGDSYNINNTQVQTTFNVTMNGETVTAEQANEDNDYISATLENEAVMGTNMFSTLSEADVKAGFDTPMDDKLQTVYDLAQKVNEDAKALKEQHGSGDTTGVDKDGWTDLQKRVKQEMNDAIDLAKAVGSASFGEGTDEERAELADADVPDADDYYKEGDYSGWFNEKGEGLDDAINETITEEMNKKGYENYGKN